jgi:hypothetical protein
VNEKIEAQTARMMKLFSERLPQAAEEVTELIVTSMALAYCEGELNGLRQAAARIETTRACAKMAKGA